MRSLRDTSVAAGAATIALAVVTRTRRLRLIDESIERLIAPHRSRLAGAARLASLPGEPYAHPAISAAIAVCVLRARKGRARRILIPLAAASLGAIMAHHAVKAVYRRPRPRIALQRGKTEPAFPSGHTADATAVLATGAYLLIREGLLSAVIAIPLATGLAFGTGMSRVGLGWHWTSDVVGGWLTGIAVGAACAEGYERLAPPKKVRWRI